MTGDMDRADWSLTIFGWIFWLIETAAIYSLFACPIYLLSGMETRSCGDYFLDAIGCYFIWMMMDLIFTYNLITSNLTESVIRLSYMRIKAYGNRNSFYFALIGSQFLMLLAIMLGCADSGGLTMYFGVAVFIFSFVDFVAFFLIEDAIFE